MFFLKKYSLLILLTLVIVFSQFVLLAPHLKYGFSDVDWGFLSIYKNQNPYSLSQFINNFKAGGTVGGVYTHQIYYIGIQEDIFGLDFVSFHKTTHLIKALATVSIFPIFLAISSSTLLAVIATAIFAFSYPSVGTLYTVVTSSDYLAIFSMGLFFLIYLCVIKNNISNWYWLITLLISLLVTIFLSTERMYPLPIFIAIIEFSLFWFKKKDFHVQTLKRIIVLLLPIFLVFLFKPQIFLDFIQRNGSELLQRIIEGNWNLILTPFISLGSMVFTQTNTEPIEIARISSFFQFIDIVIMPLVLLVFSTLLIGLVIFKHPFRFITKTLIMTAFATILLFILASHFVDHLISTKSIIQALVGLYILIAAFSSFKYWQADREKILKGLFLGPFFAFIYIVLTWVGAATSEVFTGAHRYLTLPAIGIAIFIATLVTVSYQRLHSLSRKNIFFKLVSFLPFILLIIFLKINSDRIKDFFDYQLQYGFGAADQQYMRNQLNSFLTNLSTSEPSLFYFDSEEDNLNSYYYDNTIRGGFPSWMLGNKKINFRKDLAPNYLWNQKQALLSALTTKGNIRGFQYEGKFYDIENFYAFTLREKKIINIKEKLLQELKIY